MHLETVRGGLKEVRVLRTAHEQAEGTQEHLRLDSASETELTTDLWLLFLEAGSLRRHPAVTSPAEGTSPADLETHSLI